ncbi:MAG: N-acetyltransferase [bacterium]|nr:N-acetyltransferase [bacterium]
MPSGSLTILTVTNRKEWNAFLRFPYRFYRNDPNWVPPLIRDQKVLLDPLKHPFYRHADSRFFLAIRDGRPAGRIAALVDHAHNEFHADRVGFFGFFESEEDEAVSAGLLGAARSWLKEKGRNVMRGPVNPSQNEDCGCLIDAFDSPPVIMMTYNPPYYPGLYERFGLRKAMDLYAYIADTSGGIPDKLVRVAETVRKKEGITIRTADMKRFDEEVDRIKRVYNKAWSRNWGFVPMTDAEFDHLAKNLKAAVVPDLCLIAEIAGEPVGFALSIPDMNQALIRLKGRLFPTGLLKLLWYARKIDTIRIVTLGVVHAHQQKGIDAVLYLDTWRNAMKKGYHRGEMSWILETNTMMNRSAKMLGGKVYKTYRMYQMDI